MAKALINLLPDTSHFHPSKPEGSKSIVGSIRQANPFLLPSTHTRSLPFTTPLSCFSHVSLTARVSRIPSATARGRLQTHHHSTALPLAANNRASPPILIVRAQYTPFISLARTDTSFSPAQALHALDYANGSSLSPGVPLSRLSLPCCPAALPFLLPCRLLQPETGRGLSLCPVAPVFLRAPSLITEGVRTATKTRPPDRPQPTRPTEP